MLKKRGLETIWVILLVILALVVLGVAGRVLSKIVTRGIGG
jgi:hypothetical protein